MVGGWIEVMLEAQLDELAQHRQHASVVVGDAALDQVHDVRVRLELAWLGVRVRVGVGVGGVVRVGVKGGVRGRVGVRCEWSIELAELRHEATTTPTTTPTPTPTPTTTTTTTHRAQA